MSDVCEDCGREFDGWRELKGHKTHCGKYDDAPYRDKDTLENLYIQEEKSTREIADELDTNKETVREWLQKHDIPLRKWGRQKSSRAGISLTRDGYERIQIRNPDGSVAKFRVHQALMIAEHGLEAIDGKVVHHKNNIPWDNRVENLELMTASEHSQLHNPPGEQIG